MSEEKGSQALVLLCGCQRLLKFYHVLQLLLFLILMWKFLKTLILVTFVLILLTQISTVEAAKGNTI